MTTDQTTDLGELIAALPELKPQVSSAGHLEPTTTGRGYPLPPWALEAREVQVSELIDWLTTLTDDQVAAYLEAWLLRTREAQRLASERLVKLCDATNPPHLEDQLARLTQAYADLEELYVAARTPAVAVNVELDEDDLEWRVLTVTLGYNRDLAPDLDEEAAMRVQEAAAIAAHAAYERERVAAGIVRTDVVEDDGGAAALAATRDPFDGEGGLGGVPGEFERDRGRC